MRFLSAAACLPLAIFCCPGIAQAQLTVDRLWVDFGPGDPNRADVVLRNESADRYYVTVTPAEVNDPGTEAEKRVSITDPEALGILVTPNRLVIDPGGVRAIRVVSLNGNLKTDRVYRIRIEPQVGEIAADTAAAGNRGLTIKVLAAYDVLVTARAKDPKVDLVIDRRPSEVSVRNAGNTNTLLIDGQVCVPPTPSPAQAEKCTGVGSRRLYAGNEWKILLETPEVKLRFRERRTTYGTPKDITF